MNKKFRLISSLLSFVLILNIFSTVAFANPDSDLVFSLDLSGYSASSTADAKGIVDASGANKTSSITLNNSPAVGSFVNSAEDSVKYLNFTSSSNSSLIASFSEEIPVVTYEFWANIPDISSTSVNASTNVFTGYSDATPTNGTKKSAMEIVTLQNRYTFNPGNASGMHLGTQNSGKNVVNTWAHYVITQEYDSSVLKYKTKIYVNDTAVIVGNNTFDTLPGLKSVMLGQGSLDGSRSNFGVKIASFNVYTRAFSEADAHNAYNASKATYEQLPFMLTSHTGSGEKVAYPVNLAGDVIVKNNQSLKVKVGTGDWTDVTVTNGSWSYAIPDGALGATTLTFGIFNGTNTEPSYTKALNFEFTREIALENATATITAGSPVTGSVDVINVASIGTYSVIAALYDAGKMLGYDVADVNGDFSITQNATASSYVKVFAVDSLDNAKLLSNIAVISDVNDPSSNVLAVSTPANGVNFATSQDGASFDVSLVSNKTNKDGVVIIKTETDTVDYINTVTTDSNGKANFKYVLNNEDDNYSIKANIAGVTGTYTFKYYSELYIAGLLQAIENATADNLYDTVLNETTIGYKEALALDLTDYGNLDPERKTTVNTAVAGKPYTSTGDFNNAFIAAVNEQIFLQTMEATAANASASKISEFIDIVGNDLDGLYSFLTPDEKTEVFTAQKATPHATYTDYINSLKEKVAVEIVKVKTSGYFVDNELVEDYADELNIDNSDKSTYEGMTDKDKKRVIVYVKAVENIDSLTDINAAFAEAIEYVSDPENATVITPIMKLDYSNADSGSATESKGIVETVDGLTVTATGISETKTYQTEAGTQLKYAELDGASSNITVDMGSVDTQEGTLTFWANIDSSVVLNTGTINVSNGSSKALFSVKTGASFEHMKGQYFEHRNNVGQYASLHATIPANPTRDAYNSSASYFDDWRHYAFTYKWDDEGENLVLSIYVDGILIKDAKGESIRPVPGTDDPLKLILGGGAKVKIAETAYYQDYLDADTVKRLYVDEKPSHEAAALNIENYIQGEEVTYPFTLEGTASVETGGKLEISLDGETYNEISVAGGEWTYLFANGELGVKNVSFRVKDASDNVESESVLPITFTYPIKLHTATASNVSVQKVYSDNALNNLVADIIAVVYDNTGKVTDIDKFDVTISNLDPVTALTNSTYTAGSSIKYIAVDDVTTMNLMAEPVFYGTSTELSATAQYVTADSVEIDADVTTTDTYNTVISLAAITESDKAVITVTNPGGSLCYVGVANVDANGKAAVTYIQDAPVLDSDYTMNAKIGNKTVTKTFRYYNTTSVNDTLTAIAGSTVDNFEANIINNVTHKNVLQIDTTPFADTVGELDGTVYERNVFSAVAGKTFTSVSAFKDTFIAAVKDQTILKALSEATWDIDAAADDVDADVLINLYADYIGIDLTRAYDIVDDIYKEDILKNTVSGKTYTDIDDLKDAFTKESMVQFFDYKDVLEILYEDIINTYAADFNLAAGDLAVYNAFTESSYKLQAIEALKLAGVNTYADFNTKFSFAVNGVDTSGNGGDDGDTGGSYSPGPSFVPSTDSELNDVVDQTEAEAVSNSIFKDMRTDHWAYPSVEKLVNLGVLNGIGDGKFNPEGNVTREQFCKMLLEALDIEINAEATSSFGDVNADAWYFDYVATAQKLGIVNGITDTQFGVGKSITRAEMCAMVSRAVEYSFNKLSSITEEKNFTDADQIPEYAVEYVKQLTKAGIINGFEDSSFRANATATRAMAAKVIDNLIGNIK